ncbi:hypothetical protein LTR62_006859 [Meristemomyces frigidus]|uniref:Uncharacterized protein n=1 Tax=Meristemomyces frigidus TaxID=1508187 RepID=A0AAN7TBD2_9PEZI|nr:hypothetical protein LTR62_006859 [Meristemomyces frigidus]
MPPPPVPFQTRTRRSGFTGPVAPPLTPPPAPKRWKCKLKDHLDLPSFDDDSFSIYFWQFPPPRDYTNLRPYHQSWKIKQDQEDAEDEIMNDSLEWADQSLFPLDYGSSRNMYHALARGYVNRAKRAFRSGMSWEQFVRDETSLTDEEAADGCELRLAILERIAERLCNEIWSQQYPGSDWVWEARRDSMAFDGLDTVAPAIADTAVTGPAAALPAPAASLPAVANGAAAHGRSDSILKLGKQRNEGGAANDELVATCGSLFEKTKRRKKKR